MNEMIKVFLAEDEFTIRDGIKRRIAWEENGFIFSGEADNGESAYEMIRQKQPDILITDIKMPFMDGLEMSRMLRERMPNLKIIILSGYDDFSYARQAIQIGVTEYLLKPVTAGKLLNALLDVKREVMEERQQKQFLQTFLKEREENERILRYQFFNELVSGRYNSLELLKRGQEIGLLLKAAGYNLLLFKISAGDYEDSTQYQEKQVKLGSKLEEHFCAKEGVIYFERITEGGALLVKGSTPQEVREKASECIRELKEMAKAWDGLHYFVGVGKQIKNLADITECYYQANKAFTFRFLMSGNHVLCSEETKGLPIAKEDKIDLRNINVEHFDKRIVMNFLKNGLKTDVEFFVDQYIHNMGKGNMSSLMFRQYVVMDINFVIMQFQEELGWNSEDILDKFADFGNVTGYTDSLEATRKYLIRSIEASMDLRELAAMSKYSAMISKAKKFIQDHYNDEKISLNATAASVNVSPNHFSRIFSQESGATFIEYLTEIRMDKAKELLRNTKIKTSDVGFEVGYKDSHYFYYLFKKMEQCTPKDYRMKYQDY